VRAATFIHQGLFMDRLSRAVGMAWEPRSRRHSTVPRYAVAGVPRGPSAEFSQRGAVIEAIKNRLVQDFRARRGREPNATAVLKITQLGRIDRPSPKHSLADLTELWRNRARQFVGPDTAGWALQIGRAGAVSF